MALQHLRASTADKRPTPAAMADGQLAMNTNLGSPGLFFKDSNGDLVKTGPVHVGTTAPNATPAVGGQAGNSKGELWLDTTGSDYTLKTWDGSAWREIVVTSTMIKDGTIVNADINASAAIVDTKLATIATAGKVSNSATTATNANTASAIVARDASGNFTAGTITAALTGAASSNVLKAGDTMTGALVVPLASAATPSLTFTSDLNTGIYSPGADQVAISTNGSQRLLINSGGITSANGGVFQGDASSYATDGLALTFNSNNSEIRACRSGGNYTNMLFYTQGANSSGAQQERMRLTSEGLLGLGTSSPGALLDLAGGAIRLDSTNGIYKANADGFNYLSGGTSIADGGVLIPFGQSHVTNANEIHFRNASNTTRMVIDASGRVGIGTTSPQNQLVVSNGGAAGLELSPTGFIGAPVIVSYNRSGAAYSQLALDGATNVFAISGTERARIDSSGRLLVGTSTARTLGSVTAALEIEGTSFSGSSISLVNNENTANGAFLNFGKSRGASVGSNTIVNSGDNIAHILFYGANGSGANVAAAIDVQVDGTPGANDMPGRLVFSVTADGAASPTEALRISNDRSITVSDGGNVVLGTTTGTKIGTATTQKLGFYNATPVVQPAAVADATTAVDVITQLNDLLAKLRTLGIIAT
jgi:hypothetical protein